MIDSLGLSLFTWQEVALRVAIAMVIGLAIGWERDCKNKPIDFRAYMIVCVTTCVIAIMSQELSNNFAQGQDFFDLDLGKIISGTLTGIGFLGAGAIIKREDDRVVGTATGASIWASGGLGLTIGFGAYGLTFIGFAAIALTLLVGGYFMPKVNGHEEEGLGE